MPVFQSLVDFDAMFHQLSQTPILISDLPNDTADKREKIKALITTRYSSDMLSVLPQCNCGELKGEFVIGETCHTCESEVQIAHDVGSEPLVWFKAPNGVADIINPSVLLMLRERFRKVGFCAISYLIDPHYRWTATSPKALQALKELNIPRGYNHFVQNFDSIYQTLAGQRVFNTTKKTEHRDYLLDLIQRDRHKIFSRNLPLPNRTLLVIESTVVGTYLDPIIVSAINAIETLVGLDAPDSGFSDKAKESRTAKALLLLSDYYHNYIKNNLAKKTGIFRKHVFGSRTHFSFRSVITSITEPHNYDEIYIPWAVANAVLRPHLVNKLMRRGFTHAEAINFLHAKSEVYDPLLEELHTELLNEHPDRKGISCLMQRNPSLLQG